MRDLLWGCDEHLRHDAEFPALRGKRDRQRCDARREGAKHRRDVLPAPSRTRPTPAEMLVVERKRVPYFAAGSGGMQQT
jgi:hypothetical protein